MQKSVFGFGMTRREDPLAQHWAQERPSIHLYDLSIIFILQARFLTTTAHQNSTDYSAECHQCLQPAWLAALTVGSTVPHRIERGFDDAAAEQLRAMLHQSPRTFGKETSLWTLELAAEVSFEQGLTPEPVSCGSTDRLTAAGRALETRQTMAHEPCPGVRAKKPTATPD